MMEFNPDSSWAHLLRFSPMPNRDRETTDTTGKNNVKRDTGKLARAHKKSHLKQLFSTILDLDCELRPILNTQLEHT